MLAPVHADTLQRLETSLSSIVKGDKTAIELVLIGLLAEGHVLIEDVPGVGKTTLAKALAASLDMDFARVQCTPDLLPSDILGSNVLDPRSGTLSFHKGPVFTQVLLVDETNRASPRTQSGLLEAMNERQVSIDGTTYPLPAPFFVVATQNPVDFHGTYPLPIAQLDRFLMRIQLGYPSEEEEMQVLFERQLEDPLSKVRPVAETSTLRAIQKSVREIRVEPDVGRYLLRIVRGTRSSKELELGVSPRGALAFFRACQARALLRGRDYASPDDVQALAESVLAHRVVTTAQARYAGVTPSSVIAELLATVEVPA
jgi:MoxR-like ATPase